MTKTLSVLLMPASTSKREGRHCEAMTERGFSISLRYSARYLLGLLADISQDTAISVQNLATNGEEMQSGETNWQKLLRMNPEEKRNLLFRYFSQWAGIGDSYIYDLTRVKEVFSIGTVSLDDFVEWDEERIGTLVDEFMQWLAQEGE